MTHLSVDLVRVKALTWSLLSSTAGLAAVLSFVLMRDRVTERELAPSLIFWSAAVACWVAAYIAGRLAKQHQRREPGVIVATLFLRWLLVIATTGAALQTLPGLALR